MRKLLFITALAVTALSCKSTKYTIIGDIYNTNGDAELYYDIGDKMCDLEVKDGKFELSGDIKEPTIVGLQGAGLTSVKPFILEPGTIYITGDAVLGIVVVGGTELNERLNIANATLEKINQPEVSKEDYVEGLVNIVKENHDNIIATQTMSILRSTAGLADIERAFDCLSPKMQKKADMEVLKMEIDKAKESVK